MRRLKNLADWTVEMVGCACILTLCIAVSFWDSVVMGRSVGDQSEGEL